MKYLEELICDLPSPEAARRFFDQFSERNPNQTKKLIKNDALFSDVLALASYSPLLGTTLTQAPEYVAWLEKERADVSVRGKEALLESLARFALINSSLEPHVLFARFRRRELLRIFLRDIRRLGTIAEITEEISNLADTILENALRIARQEMDNRFGTPMETDENGRKRSSDVSIVALGKLGSKELNYSSDIDLLFIYSADGATTGTGTRGSVTNREYFSKLAETVTGLVGRQSGEGAAYRVDMRLRPHGRVGALALSLKETTKYYLTDARNWERQVLIRSRASAGDPRIFKTFFSDVEDVVFMPGCDPSDALREVLRSKEKIDDVHRSGPLLNVKLGRGGIREIEFIAQALQLAYGGSDRWLHVGHSLKSISRLADRGYLTEDERSRLSNAYDFLRRLEHILQMEHGLQTHSLPGDPERLAVVALKMHCVDLDKFRAEFTEHTNNVHQTFLRVFGTDQVQLQHANSSTFDRSVEKDLAAANPELVPVATTHFEEQIIESVNTLDAEIKLDPERRAIIRKISNVSPKFAQLIISKPWLAQHLKRDSPMTGELDYDAELSKAVDPRGSAPTILAELRFAWSRLLLQIAVADIFEDISTSESRTRQTKLAEAGIRIGLLAAANDLDKRFDFPSFAPVVMALGKLGSGTLDYDSDLDVIMSYNGRMDANSTIPEGEYYGRGVDSFVNFLSGMTRDGNLYRVDLRLRPHGKNGPNVITLDALCDYIVNKASVWELLAYVQFRAVGTDPETSGSFEEKVRQAIAFRVAREDTDAIKRESREMRLRLEETHGRPRSRREIDIKFGPGGLLDVYFVVRCLQLSVIDKIGADVRSTTDKLYEFERSGVLSSDNYSALRQGHDFLTELDHNIRLVIGRSSRFPRGNLPALERITKRMRLGSVKVLNEQLAIHRINIRAAFERILQ